MFEKYCNMCIKSSIEKRQEIMKFNNAIQLPSL